LSAVTDRLRLHPSLRDHGPWQHGTPDDVASALMIFFDCPENHGFQSRTRSREKYFLQINGSKRTSWISGEPFITVRQQTIQTFRKNFSFRRFRCYNILFGEAEAGSAEEQPCRGITEPMEMPGLNLCIWVRFFSKHHFQQ
jgi:hypothetical protein